MSPGERDRAWEPGTEPTSTRFVAAASLSLGLPLHLQLYLYVVPVVKMPTCPGQSPVTSSRLLSVSPTSAQVL